MTPVNGIEIVRREDWAKYAPYFSPQEFTCSKTGKVFMAAKFMDALLALRKAYGKPMVITSGFRDVTHPSEIKKEIKGDHTRGLAADVACWSDEAFLIVELAYKLDLGFNRFGISQASGKPRFIHLAISESPGKALYSY
jgi:zinc D-Ala-D-Ala carboxypeptidase